MRRNEGFSLVELLVVIGIIAVLAAILMPTLAFARLHAKSAPCTSNLHQIGIAMLNYVDDNEGLYPPIVFYWQVGGSFAESVDRDKHEALERERPNALHNIFNPYVKNQGIFHCPADRGVRLPQDEAQDVIGSIHAPKSLSREGVPLYERFGDSYRAAGELGDPTYGITESNVPDKTKILFAADASGFWHTKSYASTDISANRSDGGDDHWFIDTLYLDGHVKCSAFTKDVWVPYLKFLSDFYKQRLRSG